MKRQAVKSVADQMGWTIAKAAQFVNMMARSGKGWDDDKSAKGGGRKGKHKQDIEQIDAIAKEFNMDIPTRKKFGKYIENLKESGHGGSLNKKGDFTFSELKDIAQKFVEQK